MPYNTRKATPTHTHTPLTPQPPILASQPERTFLLMVNLRMRPSCSLPPDMRSAVDRAGALSVGTVGRRCVGQSIHKSMDLDRARERANGRGVASSIETRHARPDRGRAPTLPHEPSPPHTRRDRARGRAGACGAAPILPLDCALKPSPPPEALSSFPFPPAMRALTEGLGGGEEAEEDGSDLHGLRGC